MCWCECSRSCLYLCVVYMCEYVYVAMSISVCLSLFRSLSLSLSLSFSFSLPLCMYLCRQSLMCVKILGILSRCQSQSILFSRVIGPLFGICKHKHRTRDSTIHGLKDQIIIRSSRHKHIHSKDPPNNGVCKNKRRFDQKKARTLERVLKPKLTVARVMACSLFPWQRSSTSSRGNAPYPPLPLIPTPRPSILTPPPLSPSPPGAPWPVNWFWAFHRRALVTSNTFSAIYYEAVCNRSWLWAAALEIGLLLSLKLISSSWWSKSSPVYEKQIQSGLTFDVNSRNPLCFLYEQRAVTVRNEPKFKPRITFANARVHSVTCPRENETLVRPTVWERALGRQKARCS